MTAPSLKRPINVSLNEDLVREARTLTPDLSGTIESLLHGFVERARAQRRDEDRTIDAVVADLDAFHRQHGLLSDEFSSL